MPSTARGPFLNSRTRPAASIPFCFAQPSMIDTTGGGDAVYLGVDEGAHPHLQPGDGRLPAGRPGAGCRSRAWIACRRAGPLLIVGNHDSHWDPVMVGIAARNRRQIRALAKSDLWKVRGLGPVLNGMGQIPIERGKGDARPWRGRSGAAGRRLHRRLPRGHALRAAGPAGPQRRRPPRARGAGGARHPGRDRGDHGPPRLPPPAPHPRPLLRPRGGQARPGEDPGRSLPGCSPRSASWSRRSPPAAEVEARV